MTKQKLYLNGLALIGATMLSNVFNFIYNVFLGRSLTLQEFGDISLFTSLLYLVSIPLGAFSSTTAHSIAKLFGKYSIQHAQGYFRYIFSKSIIYGVALTTLWVFFTPLLNNFFHLNSSILMLSFAPLWMIDIVSSNYYGYLKGTLAFGKIAIISVSESCTRLLLAYLLITYGLSEFTVLSIVGSYIVMAICGWLLSKNVKPKNLKIEEKKFNSLFFLTSAITGISVITFLTLDVVMVKHLLSRTEAGEYGLLSLIGKMTYFVGSLLAPFMIPLVSHNEGAKKDSKQAFYFLFLTTAFFSISSFIGLGLFGHLFLPVVFGQNIINVLPLFPVYILAISIFTITQPIVSYFQAKENYSFAMVGFLVSILQVTLIILFHNNLTQIVWVMLTTSIVNLSLMIMLYFTRSKLQVFYLKSIEVVKRKAYGI